MGNAGRHDESGGKVLTGLELARLLGVRWGIKAASFPVDFGHAENYNSKVLNRRHQIWAGLAGLPRREGD